MFKALYFLFPIFLDALIVQTNQFEQVLAHVDSETWVFYDIDDTVLTSQLQLGRSDYYLLDFEKLKQRGLDEESAHEICRLRWNEMQEKCPVRPMEPAVPKVVRQTQQTAAYAIGLTARGPQTNHITRQQLHSLDLDFSISSPATISIDLPFRNTYHSGVWFVEFNKKGTSVRKWLSELTEHPAKIVFVDDRLHHLENMEEELSDLAIEYVGVHYSKVLETPFNPQIAQIQAEFFPRIVTDEEALEHLKN